MSELLILGLVLLTTAAVIILIALAVNPRLRAEVRLPQMRFRIDTSRPSVPTKSQTSQVAAASKAQTHVWLAIKQRGRADWEYSLDGKTNIYVGRRDDNQINLAYDLAADTRHAVIYFENNRYYINNLSPKGTRVNNRLVTKQVLGDGNTIQMGNTKIIFYERHR